LPVEPVQWPVKLRQISSANNCMAKKSKI